MNQLWCEVNISCSLFFIEKYQYSISFIPYKSSNSFKFKNNFFYLFFAMKKHSIIFLGFESYPIIFSIYWSLCEKYIFFILFRVCLMWQTHSLQIYFQLMYQWMRWMICLEFINDRKMHIWVLFSWNIFVKTRTEVEEKYWKTEVSQESG